MNKLRDIILINKTIINLTIYEGLLNLNRNIEIFDSTLRDGAQDRHIIFIGR